MGLAAFNQFLGAAVKSGASDIHFKAGVAPAVRASNASDLERALSFGA